MINSLRGFFCTIGCIIGWGAFIGPETFFIPEIGTNNAIIGILIGSFLINGIVRSLSTNDTSPFILEWFTLLTYLCILTLNLLNSFVILKYLGDFNVQEAVIICFCSTIIGLGFYVSKINRGLILKIYSALSMLFLILLALMEIIIIFLFSINANLIQNAILHALDYQKIFNAIAISPWLFVGFNYAITQSGYHQKLIAHASIFFSTLLYISLIILVDLDNTHSIQNIMKENFGIYGVLFLFFVTLFSISSGFLGFLILAQDKIYTHLPQQKGYYALTIFSISLVILNKDNLQYLITISSLGLILNFTFFSSLDFLKSRNIQSFFSVFSSIVLLICSIIPQNLSLYNPSTISILILWIIFGLFVYHSSKINQKSF